MWHQFRFVSHLSGIYDTIKSFHFLFRRLISVQLSNKHVWKKNIFVLFELVFHGTLEERNDCKILNSLFSEVANENCKVRETFQSSPFKVETVFHECIKTTTYNSRIRSYINKILFKLEDFNLQNS